MLIPFYLLTAPASSACVEGTIIRVALCAPAMNVGQFVLVSDGAPRFSRSSQVGLAMKAV